MADLISLDEYKELEGISNTKDDTRLESLISSVSQLVKSYLGYSIVDYFVSAKIEEFSLEWAVDKIDLSEIPVNTVSTVEIRDNPGVAYTTLSSSEYYADKQISAVYRIGGNTTTTWPVGPGAVKITYTGGYQTLPLDLKLAVSDLITYYFRNEHKPRQTLSGATQENTERSSSRYLGFPDHIRRVLDLYRLAL